jgi:ribonuclease Z
MNQPQQPLLVNGRFGDPAVYVDMPRRTGAILFDLGDLAPLGTRELLRVGFVFVSHMHMDHFIGFDRLLRVHVGQEKRISMVGPAGFAAAVGHKLSAYSWDLVDRFESDFVIDAVEIGAPDKVAATRFRLKTAFAPEPAEAPPPGTGLVLAWPHFDLTVAILEHHGPSLGFAVQQPLQLNILPDRLEARGLAPGPWLEGLRQAVRDDSADDSHVATPGGGSAPLGELRELVAVERGRKIVYVTDVIDNESNRRAIEALARDADILVIESCFAESDSSQAERRAHLTTRAAGEIARAAGARRIEPFHFSPRYLDREAAMLAEVEAAFAGRQGPESAAIDTAK